MSYNKRDPFRDIYTTQDRMKMVFDGSLSGAEAIADEQSRYVWSPNVDIYETSDSIVLKGELPGIEKNDINVEVKEDTIIIKGERKFKRNIREENYHRMERSYGLFKRSFALPGKVMKEGVKAKHRDGVLEIIMPKVKKTGRRK